MRWRPLTESLQWIPNFAESRLRFTRFGQHQSSKLRSSPWVLQNYKCNSEYADHKFRCADHVSKLCHFWSTETKDPTKRLDSLTPVAMPG
jgi:hypothetical protein